MKKIYSEACKDCEEILKKRPNCKGCEFKKAYQELKKGAYVLYQGYKVRTAPSGEEMIARQKMAEAKTEAEIKKVYEEWGSVLLRK
jgi:hypothetical protein